MIGRNTGDKCMLAGSFHIARMPPGESAGESGRNSLICLHGSGFGALGQQSGLPHQIHLIERQAHELRSVQQPRINSQFCEGDPQMLNPVPGGIDAKVTDFSFPAFRPFNRFAHVTSSVTPPYTIPTTKISWTFHIAAPIAEVRTLSQLTSKNLAV